MITSQPTNLTVLAGGTANLTVIVSGAGALTYQWQLDGTNLPNGVIATVAGGGTPGAGDDGVAATNVSLANPAGVVVDESGNLFIAEADSARIRKVSTGGRITTVVGNGTVGYSGDGGPAIAASLANPTGLALDGRGNLFIADTWNNAVRKVDAHGTITTVAGNGTQGFAGDGGLAIDATMTGPSGVAVDAAGNVFIADSWNHRIREVDTNGIITTVAGNGAGGYSGDGGAATNASLKYPGGLAVDRAGNLFIADAGNNRVRKVDTRGVMTTVAGDGRFTYAGDGGAATNASLANPLALALDAAGDLFIADQYSYRIRVVDTNGVIITVAGSGALGYSGDGGAATNASLANPCAVALDVAGDLFIADAGNNRIREVTLLDRPTLTLIGVSTANGGDYQVIVANPDGSVTSVVATVTVVFPPAITEEPSDQLAQPGSTVTLQVTAVGTGSLQYQWQ
ncbi:MAG: hypothetical protein KGS61_20705, partial [Verrucomicrobia bacterium]|nr:hypothetical protein [Verrucomicrobiota bacterium]